MLTDVPPSEPPILELSVANGIEDTPVLLRLSASPGEQGTSEQELSVTVVSFPEGTTFSKGTPGISSSWTFSQAEFGEVDVHLPPHLSGEVTIEAIALTSGASRQGSVQFVITPVADAPDLTVGDTCYDLTSRSFRLAISASLIDGDGSENLRVYVELPENITVVGGEEDNTGRYPINSQDLGNVTGRVFGSPGSFMVTVVAVSVEHLNGDSANTTVSLSVQSCVDTESTDGKLHVKV